MHPHARTVSALLATLALACTGEKRPEPPPPTTPAAAPSGPSAAAPAADTNPSAPEAKPPASEAKPPARAPRAEAPAPEPASPAATPATGPARKPAEEAAAAPAAPAPAAGGDAHARVGPDKCKMCHRLQHQSWAASPHAAKGLDCEGCHGNGGDYWSASVMRDRERAVAAGLVLPTLEACKRCHAKADPARFSKVHAHKAG